MYKYARNWLFDLAMEGAVEISETEYSIGVVYA
jgi:hypothetical protein